MSKICSQCTSQAEDNAQICPQCAQPFIVQAPNPGRVTTIPEKIKDARRKAAWYYVLCVAGIIVLAIANYRPGSGLIKLPLNTYNYILPFNNGGTTGWLLTIFGFLMGVGGALGILYHNRKKMELIKQLKGMSGRT